jgi:fructokinase
MGIFGGIEAGGTKFVCAIGTGPEDLTVYSFPTGDPEATVQQAVRFFQEKAGAQLEGLGIGAFGPLDLDRASPTYGHITCTPKRGWQQFDLAGTLARALHIPVGLETDVNAAVLAEGRWGAARNLENCLYLTVGTGIGGGALVGSRLLHGLMHPEMGHIRIPHDLTNDPYPGHCPYHGDCLEGLASGPAIEARWGTPAQALPVDHPAWVLEARYLALALSTWVCTLSPQRILLGGGVMQREFLFPMIRTELKALLNDYIPQPAFRDQLKQYVMPPQLGPQAGVLGALWLGQQAARSA